MVYHQKENPCPVQRSEVDPTGSLWYTPRRVSHARAAVLKLTLPGHYGITEDGGEEEELAF